MKISSINNLQNFTGLWGNTKVENAGNEFTSLSYVTKYYYPFKDEDLGVIREIEKSNSGNFVGDWHETGGTYVKEVCSVETRKPLSFTEKEFNLYKQSNIGAMSPENVKNPVEKELVSRGLYKYLNNADKYSEAIKKQGSIACKVVNFFKKIAHKVKHK